PAGTAELFPLLEELAVLIEYFNPIVVPVADEQAPFGVHSQSMGLIKLARSSAELAPGFGQLAVFRKLQNARSAACSAGVAFRHEDIAIRRNEHVIRLKEEFGITTAACLTER